MNLRPRQKIGTIPWEPTSFGESVLGTPLHVWRPAEECRVLVFAAIHGEEPESTIVLSRALRHLTEPSPHCAVVLALNPDGVSRGTRGNANGVDLNRNFPTRTWAPDPVCHRATMNDPRDVELSPGEAAGSEPETRALMALVDELSPESVVAIHAPLACLEDPKSHPLAHWFAKRVNLPVVDDVGYPTPGSFGTWCAERDLHVITYELEDASVETLIGVHTPAFVELLSGGFHAE